MGGTRDQDPWGCRGHWDLSRGISQRQVLHCQAPRPAGDTGGTSAPCYLFVSVLAAVRVCVRANKVLAWTRGQVCRWGSTGDSGVMWGVVRSGNPPEGSVSPSPGVKAPSHPVPCLEWTCIPPKEAGWGDQDIIYCLSRGTVCVWVMLWSPEARRGHHVALGMAGTLEDQSPRPSR